MTNVPDLSDPVVTFSVMGGIFGVGRLASRLKAMESVNLIGSWPLVTGLTTPIKQSAYGLITSRMPN